MIEAVEERPTQPEQHPPSPPFSKHMDGLHHRSKVAPHVTPESLLVKEIKALKSHIQPPVPNPAPLGLIAFGLTTALLQVKHTRIAGDTKEELDGVDTVVMGFAMFFGGLLQIIAGISEIKRNNLFGYTAFCLYGGFWMSIGTVEIVSLLSTGALPVVNPKASQAMLFMVGAFTFMLWVLTLKMNKTISSLFFLLGITLWLLCFGVQNETADQVGGYLGLATAANAFWLAFVELYNDVIGEGREEISLGHWHWNEKTHSHGGIHKRGRIQGLHPSLVWGRDSIIKGAAHKSGNIQAVGPTEFFGTETNGDVEAGLGSGNTSGTGITD
jgi:hypothetical protein